MNKRQGGTHRRPKRQPGRRTLAMVLAAVLLLTSLTGLTTALSFGALGRTDKILYDFEGIVSLTELTGLSGEGLTLALGQDTEPAASGRALKTVRNENGDPSLTFCGEAGTFSGTGLSFWAAGPAVLSELRLWYRDSQNRETYAVRKTELSLTAETGKVYTVAYDAALSAVADRAVRAQLVLSVVGEPADTALFWDDITVTGHRDTVAPTAALAIAGRTDTSLTVTVTPADNDTPATDLRVEAFYATIPLTRETLAALDAEDATGEVSVAASDKGLTSFSLTELLPGKTYYIGVRITDRAGLVGYALCEGTTRADTVTLYRADASARELIVSSRGAQVTVNREAALAASGASAHVKLEKQATAEVTFTGRTGDFDGESLSLWYRAVLTGGTDASYLKLKEARFYAANGDLLTALPAAVTLATGTQTVAGQTLTLPYDAAAQKVIDKAAAVTLALESSRDFAAVRQELYLDDIAVNGAKDRTAPVAENGTAVYENGTAELTFDLYDRDSEPGEIFTELFVTQATVTSTLVAHRTDADSPLLPVLSGYGLKKASVDGLVAGAAYTAVVVTADGAGNHGYSTFDFTAQTARQRATGHVRRVAENGDTLAVIEDFEGGIGRIWGGNTYRTADRSEDAISGTSLRLQPTTQYAYWGFKTFLGDLAGDGLAYTYKNVGETNVQVYLFAVQYLDDSGSTQEFRWEWSFGTTTWGAGKTDTVKLLWPETVQAVKENLIGFYMWTNTPSYDVMIDNIAVINPTKTMAGSKGSSRLVQDYENVADVSKVATQVNLGTVEITEHGGSNRLTYHYTSGEQYPNIYFMGQPGDFAGTGVSFDWESSTGATPDAHNVFAMYYDEAGQPQQAPIYAANYGGAWAPLNFGSDRTVTLSYFNNMSATAMTRDLASRIYGIRVVFANASGTADFYLDNLTTISPFDMTPPTATVKMITLPDQKVQITLSVSDNDTPDEDIEVAVYLSETAITEENVGMLTPIASGKGAISVPVQKNLKEGTVYYVAVRATDADGNTGLTVETFSLTDPETIIQDYENVTDLGKVVGLSQGEGYQTASIEEYNGSRQLHLVCKGNGNYPNFQIKGEAGDFVGTAFKFDLTVVGGGSIGFDNAYITTTNGNLSLWSYGALQNGTVTVDLSGYTEDVKKTITGFRFYNNGNSAYEAYVDNLRVVNQKKIAAGDLLVQDYENVTDLDAVSWQENMGGTREIAEHGGSRMLHFKNDYKRDYPNIYLYGQEGDFDGDFVEFYYENTANAGIDRLWAIAKVNGKDELILLKQYFTPTSGTVLRLSLAGLTDEQRAGIYGFRWHYGVMNGKDMEVYVDNLTTCSYRSGLTRLSVSEPAKNGDVTLSWALSDKKGLAAEDYTLTVYRAATAITTAMVADFEKGTDMATLTKVTEGAGLRQVTATGLPRYTTNYFAVKATNSLGQTFYWFPSVTEEKYTTVQDYEGLSSLRGVAGSNAMVSMELVKDGENTRVQWVWDPANGWDWPSLYLYFKPGDLAGDTLRFLFDYESTQNLGITNSYLFYYDSEGAVKFVDLRQYYAPQAGQFLELALPASMTMAERASAYALQLVFGAQCSHTARFAVTVDDVQVKNYRDGAHSLSVEYDENKDDGTAYLTWSLSDRLGDTSSVQVAVFAQKEPLDEADLLAYFDDPAGAALRPAATGQGLTAAVCAVPAAERYQTHWFAVVTEDQAGNRAYALLQNAEIRYRPLYTFENVSDLSQLRAATSSLSGSRGVYINADGAYGVVSSVVKAEDTEEIVRAYLKGQAMKMRFTKDYHVDTNRWPGLTFYAPNYADFAGDGFTMTFAKTPNEAGQYLPLNMQISTIMEDGSMYSTDTWSSEVISANEDGKVLTVPYTKLRRFENGTLGEAMDPADSENIVGLWLIIMAPLEWGEFSVYVDSIKVYNPREIVRPLQKIEFTEEKVTVRPKGAYTPSYALVPKNTTMGFLTWSSSKPEVATVDENGQVTAIGKGSAWITATSQNAVSGSYKVVVKESVDGVFRLLDDFDSGADPAGFTVSGYTEMQLDYLHVDALNSVKFSGTGAGGTVVYTAPDYQFYGDGIGLWAYGPQGGNATVTMKTDKGKAFSATYPIDGDEGDFAVLRYAELKQNGTGAAPTEEDIIHFKTLTVVYGGRELYLDSFKVRNPRVYNVFNPPQNDAGGTGITVAQPMLTKSRAVFHALALGEETLDFSWAMGQMKANGYFTAPEDYALFSLYFLDDYWQEKALSGQTQVTVPVPAALSGLDNIWVIRLAADGSLIGIPSENDRENLRFETDKGGVFCLWGRYDTVGLYYKKKDVSPENPDTPVQPTEPETPSVPDTPDTPEEPTKPELPADVLAQGSCSENLTYTLYEDGELVISGTGAMYDYDDEAPWADYLDQIRYVTVLDGATSIGNGAFYGCSNLEDVLLCSTLTKIGKYAFFQCEALRHITVPAGVTEIGEYAIGYTADATGQFTAVDGFVLYGTPGTAAETYAGDYRLAFNTADKAPVRDKGGLPVWGWVLIGVGGAAVLAGLTVLLVVLIRKKHDGQENEEVTVHE